MNIRASLLSCQSTGFSSMNPKRILILVLYAYCYVDNILRRSHQFVSRYQSQFVPK